MGPRSGKVNVTTRGNIAYDAFLWTNFFSDGTRGVSLTPVRRNRTPILQKHGYLFL